METQQIASQSEQPPKSQFEKHFQTVLLTLISAAILAGVSRIYTMSESLARMEERDMVKVQQIQNLQESFKAMQNDLKDVQARVIKLESQNSNSSSKQ